MNNDVTPPPDPLVNFPMTCLTGFGVMISGQKASLTRLIDFPFIGEPVIFREQDFVGRHQCSEHAVHT